MKRIGVGLLVTLAVVVLLVPGGWAQEFQLPITVQESAGVARQGEPVSGGIPLAPGKFKQDQTFTLLEGAREIPLQVSPLVVDNMGYLRWVLLDFQTDLEAGARKVFSFRTAKPVAQPAMAMQVKKIRSGLSIDTGKLVLLIKRKKPFALFDSVKVHNREVLSGGVISYTDGFDGKRYLADKPSSIEVEYAGPMRTTVCIKGHFIGDKKSKLGYIARITAWAGRSDVHLKYSLTNSNPKHYCYRLIRDSRIELNLRDKVTNTILGAGKPIPIKGNGWLYQGLLLYAANQDIEGAVKAGTGEEVLWTGNGREDRPQGWILAQTPDVRVCVCDLYYADDPPRRLATTGDSLILTGTTERFKSPTDKRAGRDRQVGQPFMDKYRWLIDCSHFSSQYLIDFDAPASTDQVLANCKRAQSNLLAMAPPAWYFQTQSLAVGKFGTQADELTCYDKWAWEYDPARAPRTPGRSYPRWIRGEDNHYETEEDIVESLLLMYLRTGRRAFFDNCQTWANYNMDLQPWRTDGWRWKDGGVWWTSRNSPLGNRPQRGADPVIGMRNRLPHSPIARKNTAVKIKDDMVTFKVPLSRASVQDLHFLADAKACHCHNWGAGIAEWYCITGDRDALETAIDNVEQNIDTQHRAFRKIPGQTSSFSRDFTRACYLTNATRMVVPTDPFVTKASDYLTAVYLERPIREPRGLVNGAQPSRGPIDLRKYVGDPGIAEMKRLEVGFDSSTGMVTNPNTGAEWFVIAQPNTWMLPPLSGAMEAYYRITGNEDVMDWVIAYGQAVSRVLFQPRHGQQHPSLLLDFPLKGIAKDYASWALPEDSKDGEGIKISGYLARFHPDVAARSYSLCGEQMLKQRAYDYWNYGSHRGYWATKLHSVGGIGMWVNYYGTHSEEVIFTGRTFYEWSHPRKDAQPPGTVSDLEVTLRGSRATVTFTAPADEGGGRVARYQLKCADRPIVDYQTFLNAYASNKDSSVCNWWMAANLEGEPSPQKPASKETFTVGHIPEGASYFALRCFDDSHNRSLISNLAGTRR